MDRWRDGLIKIFRMMGGWRDKSIDRIIDR